MLTSTAQAFGRPIREAAKLLNLALSPKDCTGILDACGMQQTRSSETWIARTDSEMLAWLLVSIWLTAFSTRAIGREEGIRDATSWFFAETTHELLQAFSPRVEADVDRLLSKCDEASSYHQLLPYVLDPHGPGSRLSILRDVNTRAARDRKRSTGAYYTPSDVATYMVREAIRPCSTECKPPNIFDPACGTAVFLRAALASLRDTWPDLSTQTLATRLFGTDIDPLALQAANFVLLADCLVDASCSTSPIELWRDIRKNFACVDALRLDPERNTRPRSYSTHLTAEEPGGRFHLTSLFPHLEDSPLAIVGNPPYTKLGPREDLPALAARFSTMAERPKPTNESFPLFVEQMIRLSSTPSAIGTMVVPLSLSCNVGPQFTALRRLIERTPGQWKFAFFDREPHALFGEDVKTRNSILFWSTEHGQKQSQILSGPLRKWRAEDRAAMFSSIRFTSISSPIRDGIPKLEGPVQARAFDSLARCNDRFGHVYRTMRRTPLAESINAGKSMIFVAGTAYNFLNVFLTPPAQSVPTGATLSQNPLHAVELPSDEHAFAAFAVLSSRLAYWWWRATQDGFHVTARYLAELPFGLEFFSNAIRGNLAVCGELLWSLVKEHLIVSLNRGKASLAFSPNEFEDERTKIDGLLASQIGLHDSLIRELHSFVADTIAAKTNNHQNSAHTTS